MTGNATASFVYDGDGKQIKATLNGITAVYVGNHYEVKNSGSLGIGVVYRQV